MIDINMMKNSLPLVSVVIPCYNHENFVQASIQSVINQTYENIELIIIDDGSKDKSVEKIREMIEACKERFVRFEFRSRPNKGLSSTLNEAIEWCQGEYYSGIASDDIILNHKLKTQVEFLNNNQDVLAVFGGVKNIDEKENIISISVGKPKWYNFKRIIMHKFDLPAVTQLIRLKALKETGGYDSSIILEDWYMWLKLAKHGNIYYMGEVFALYRQHESNMSKDLYKMKQGRLHVLSFFRDSEHYNKALTNIRWFNTKKQYEDSNKEVRHLFILFSIKPLKTANFLFKKMIKRIKLFVKCV